jgi:hypothetical protein
MWNALLNFSGWALFYLAILLYVRWVCLERVYFAGQDPEAWGAGSDAAGGPWSSPDAPPSLRVPHLPYLGRPA